MPAGKAQTALVVQELVVDVRWYVVVLIFRSVPEGELQRLGLVMPIRDRSGACGQGVFLNIPGMRLRGNAYQEVICIDQVLAVGFGFCFLLFVRELVRVMLFHQGLVACTEVLQSGAGQGA